MNCSYVSQALNLSNHCFTHFLFTFSQASVATNRKRKKEVKDFVKDLKNQDVEMTVVGYFDKVTHFYCEKTQVYRYYNCQGRKTFTFFFRFLLVATDACEKSYLSRTTSGV